LPHFATLDFVTESRLGVFDVQQRTSVEFRRYVFRAKLFVAFATYRQKIKNIARLPSAVSADLRKVHDGEVTAGCVTA